MLAISENARYTNALGDALLCAMHWCFVYRFVRRGRVTGDRARPCKVSRSPTTSA